MTAYLWIGTLFLFAFFGCSGMNATGLTACGGGNPCGWISPQGRYVSDHPDLGTINDGYTDADIYYYSGSQSSPTAVISMKKEYALDDARWKPITDPEMFITIVKNMKTKGDANNVANIQGFTIKAHDARPIGVWYSDKYVYGVRFKMPADRNSYAMAQDTGDTNKSEKIITVKSRSDTFLAQAASICRRCHGAA
jgi:hypothetical protein